MLQQLLMSNLSVENFCKKKSIRPLWQINAFLGFIVISLAMPFTLNNDSCMEWLLPSSFAFLWLVFSIDKGCGGKDLCTVLDFRKVSSGQPILIASAFIAILILCYATGILSEKIMDLFEMESPKEQQLVEALKNSSLPGKILIGILVSIFAPIGEEIAFRRLLFGMLLTHGAWFSFVFTSLIFAFLHFYLKGFLSLFVLAFILQILYIKTQNLWASVQVHILFNSLTFINALLTDGI